jgi:hypothetical protein
MSILETIADQLAQEALAFAEETGDEDVIDKMSRYIGTSSPTFQEVFNTAVRMRRAELRGRQFLAEAMARAKQE